MMWGFILWFFVFLKELGDEFEGVVKWEFKWLRCWIFLLIRYFFVGFWGYFCGIVMLNLYIGVVVLVLFYDVGFIIFLWV